MEENKQSNNEDSSESNEVIDKSVDAAGEEIAEVDKAVKSADKPKWQWRMPMIAGFIVLALLLVSVGVAVMIDNGDENQTTVANDEVVQLGAAVTLIEGTVQLSPDGEAWTDATGGESLKVMDYARTLDDSRAVILLDDGSAIRLDSKTTIYLATSTSELVEVNLVEGQVYSRVTDNPARQFVVVTANEQFEAQGTAYKTSTDEEKDELEVYQSTVKVKSDETEVEEGNKYDTESKKKEGIDLEDLEKDDFVQWNKEQDEADDEYKDFLGILDDKPEKEEEEEDEPSSSGGGTTASMSLEGSARSEDIKFEWSLSGASAPNGFKLVKAKSDSTPTYGQDSSVYIGDGSARSYSYDLTDGKTYYFRVCIYRPSSGSCDTYSNSVKITAPNVPLEEVEEGEVTLEIDGDEIEWDFEGTAPHGFKVLLANEPNPQYPSNSIKYVGPGTTEVELPDKSSGTYYVRVCKYTADSNINGGCTDYSNNVEYVIE